MQTAFPGIVHSANAYPSARRTSGGILLLNFHLQFVYAAADGFVSITLLFGDTIGRFTARLMEWVHELGFCGDELAGLDWVEFGMRLFTDPEVAPAQMEAAKAAIAAMTSSMTRADLFSEAQRREVLLAPVYAPAELVHVDHFSRRGYWDVVGRRRMGQRHRARALVPAQPHAPACARRAARARRRHRGSEGCAALGAAGVRTRRCGTARRRPSVATTSRRPQGARHDLGVRRTVHHAAARRLRRRGHQGGGAGSLRRRPRGPVAACGATWGLMPPSSSAL